MLNTFHDFAGILESFGSNETVVVEDVSVYTGKSRKKWYNNNVQEKGAVVNSLSFFYLLFTNQAIVEENRFMSRKLGMVGLGQFGTNFAKLFKANPEVKA